MRAAELFYANNCGSQPCSEAFSGAMPGGGGQDHIAPEHSPQKEIYNVSIVHLMTGASMNPLVLQIRRVGIEVIINPPLVFKGTTAVRFLRLFSPMHSNLETIFTSQDTLRV